MAFICYHARQLVYFYSSKSFFFNIWGYPFHSIAVFNDICYPLTNNSLARPFHSFHPYFKDFHSNSNSFNLLPSKPCFCSFSWTILSWDYISFSILCNYFGISRPHSYFHIYLLSPSSIFVNFALDNFASRIQSSLIEILKFSPQILCWHASKF